MLHRNTAILLPDKSDSALDLVGTQASGTGIHVARRTVHNGLDPFHVGLPCPIGTSVGVGNLDTESNALATVITLRHSLHLLSVDGSQNRAFLKTLPYDNRQKRKMQAFFRKFFRFLKILLIFFHSAAIIFLKFRKR